MGVGEPDDERRRLLSAFLRDRRRLINPATPVLGEHPRRVEAIGKPVTSTEIADAAGINRRWYELAEDGEPTRASEPVLNALGDVLGLSTERRAVLLRLASPHFDRDTPLDVSLEMVDAFSSLRRYLRKLNACSTTDELLTLVQETVVSLFPETSYLTTASRLPDGGWLDHGEPIGKGSRLHAFLRYREEVIAPIDVSEPFAADALRCFPERSSPGELWTLDDQNQARIAAILGKAHAGFKLLHNPSLLAVIRSRPGFVAQLCLGDFRLFYDDDADHALVGAIVDYASLAAS